VSAAQPVPGTGTAFPAPLATAAVCIIAWHLLVTFVVVITTSFVKGLNNRYSKAIRITGMLSKLLTLQKYIQKKKTR
jgi:hypothetical protein